MKKTTEFPLFRAFKFQPTKKGITMTKKTKNLNDCVALLKRNQKIFKNRDDLFDRGRCPRPY
jgi:hypothetical protein